MGYLPPCGDVRRLHLLETRFAPVARRLMAMYPVDSVPLAACQEAVARWFGHPNWHAVTARHRRAASREARAGEAQDRSQDPASWLTEVPLKTLKSLATSLKKHSHAWQPDRETHDGHARRGRRRAEGEWSDTDVFDLMAEVMGFDHALSMRQAWDVRQKGQASRLVNWLKPIAVWKSAPPGGPWLWSRTPHEPHSDAAKLAPMARALGQDLDSGWWMGMGRRQTGAHTLLLGEAGSGRDLVLAGWVTEAMRRGQGVVWLCRHDARRASALERRFNEQAKGCWRDQDRWTLNLSGRPDLPGSRSVRVNLFDGLRSSEWVDMMAAQMAQANVHDGMWQGRAVSVLSAVSLALDWERDQDPASRPPSLARWRQALEWAALNDMAQDPRWPDHVRKALLGYLGVAREDMHAYVRALIMNACFDRWADLEDRLFNTTEARQRWDEIGIGAGPSLLLIQAGEDHRQAQNVMRLIQSALKVGLRSHRSKQEQAYDKTVDEKPPRSEDATGRTLWVFDNVLDGLPHGMAVLPGWARAFGVEMVTALDDLTALDRGQEGLSMTNDERGGTWGERRSWLDHCATKVLMRQPSNVLLSEVWSKWVPASTGAAGLVETGGDRDEGTALDASPPAWLDIKALSHYASNEALVVHEDQAWHVGLSHNLIDLD